MTRTEVKERLTDTIALMSISGIGRMRYRKLVDHFGSPSAVLEAPKSELEIVPMISHGTASMIRKGCDGDKARQTAARIIQLGWAVLFPDDPEYPHLLFETIDRPVVLFRLGEPDRPENKMIAIVGTRHATERNRRFTYKLASDLAAAGVTVISGMAEGIDSSAHRGALESGGRTVAIWGTSLDILYPPSNKSLASEIRQLGAIYSEYLPDTRPDKTTFPDRNRIISGMSEAVIVVQAGRKSGALITASCALDQGRDIFAVPGSPDDKDSYGCNNLIKKGATLLTTVDDIFEQLPRLKGEITACRFKSMPDMSDAERTMVSFLAEGPQQIDQLSRKAELPINELLGFMLALEMKGVVQELSGKRFILTE